MSSHDGRSAERPAPDALLTEIADYVLLDRAESAEARRIARYCLMDTLGCGILALGFPACTKLLGPVVPGAELPGGARVPGTRYELDPVAAAFNIGALVRWLDFNDTWLAAEWGHPSDNLGAILAVADYQSRRGARLTMADVVTAMVQAHEIQGVLALNHSFNRVGLDHVLLVRIASTAVATRLLGGSRDEIVNAVSNAWLDGGALRTYRHAPNTGSRKSWAAGDATSRGVRHALLARAGEMGYPSALTAKGWGFQDVLFKGRPIVLERPLGLVRHGERVVQDFVPGRVPRADGRRSGSSRSTGKWRRACRRSRASRSKHRRPACASSTRPGRSRILPTAIIVCSTWSPCRCCSAG